MPNAEFKPGDKVTYKPYETAYPAIVKNVQLHLRWGDNSKELQYVLTSDPDSKHTVKAVTSGRSIVESKLYEEYDPAIHGF
jgi:hypothetical protein